MNINVAIFIFTLVRFIVLSKILSIQSFSRRNNNNKNNKNVLFPEAKLGLKSPLFHLTSFKNTTRFGNIIKITIILKKGLQ
jgi:hypothetical protein